LRRELASYDIRVVDVFVNNVGYSEAYTNAIEAKQVQVQAALQAQAKVAQARAEAEQAVAKAKGEAEAISLRGKALHNNPEVLRLEAIDKLNPNAQVIICTGQTCPSFLPSGLTNGK
jgi:prohibitin 2